MVRRVRQRKKGVRLKGIADASQSMEAVSRFFPLRASTWLPALLIVLLGFVAFWPAIDGGWLWDDDFYLTANPLLHDPHRLWKIWFDPGSTINYFPIEATVQFIQWRFWHAVTFGYHFTNVVLHIVASFLVWRLLAKFSLRCAWLGGLLFTIHPTAVESVAWISELKNVLSLPPYLLAMCAWIDFEDKPRVRTYAWSLAWFLVAMLCKSTMVTFPFVILLYAWWKRGALGWTDLRRSLPFFAIALGLGLLNVLVLDWLQQNQQVQQDAIPIGGLFSRLACSGLATAFYLEKALWPMGLLPMYPQWVVNPPAPWQFLPWLAFVAVGVLLWSRRKTWGRHALLGFGFFLISVLPFTGLVTNSFMRFTWVMDHFLYIPIIGLIGLAIAAYDAFYAASSRLMRGIGAGIWAGVIVTLTIGTFLYAEVYQSPEKLWDYTIENNPGAWLARNNLSSELSGQGRFAEARAQLEESLKIRPDSVDAHYNLGVIWFQMGDIPQAMSELREALRLNSRFVEAVNSLGNCYIKQGDFANAQLQYEKALEIQPHYEDAHNNLGNVLSHDGHIPEALAQYEAALRLNPDFILARNSRGALLAESGRLPEAIEEFKAVLRITPRDPTALSNLAHAEAYLIAHPPSR